MTLPAETPEMEVGTSLGDDESQAWLERLGSSGPGRDAAIAELRALLLRAARFEIGRRATSLAHLRGGDQEDLAQQSANDALLALLGKLGEFRGDSRFTTWAYKFALFEAAVKVRRLAWQGREVPLEEDGWSVLAAAGAGLESRVETNDLLLALRRAIATELTSHQRRVLVAVTLNDVPIDVLAQRLDTNRGALYKTLHDARRKLRDALGRHGFHLDGPGGKEEP